jgi:uncharacterized protein with HEPN domain
MPSEADSAFLWDMLRAARAVGRFIAGRTRESYLADEVLQAAVERKIEIIGEAARKVSTAFQAAHPEIPWSKIQGQRHVLATTMAILNMIDFGTLPQSMFRFLPHRSSRSSRQTAPRNSITFFLCCRSASDRKSI